MIMKDNDFLVKEREGNVYFMIAVRLVFGSNIVGFGIMRV